VAFVVVVLAIFSLLVDALIGFEAVVVGFCAGGGDGGGAGGGGRLLDVFGWQALKLKFR
jgi:hypothetical protein